MTLPAPRTGLAVVFDPGDDAAFTHTALAAHGPQASRITLHPGPGTTSDTALASDLLQALGKPAHIPGQYPHGRPPLWEAAAARTTALAVTRLTVLRAHLLDQRRLQCLLDLQCQTGIHLTLVVHRPRLTAALHRADYIKSLLGTVTVSTIHQRLRDEHGLTVSVSSLRRWISATLPEETRRSQVTVCRRTRLSPQPGTSERPRLPGRRMAEAGR
ncbi:hypothetical protein [Streptomyces sp. NBC_00233]|uniref:hypothetical protein n=1 Tax=Streptomyces sp. NBC_00233 TaxID=2975686 RepID=UPI00225688DE|nr:hypothetical protein [Streptomyces sp. NBC_00233]MCX5233447.1 hypothetical protein [Streptomyces sp. NBC_00233]